MSRFIELQGNTTTRANNYLTRAIGPEAFVEPQVGHFRLKKEDYVILLTDGVYRYVKPFDVLHLLKESSSIVQFTNMIFDTALKKGGKDNLSIIIGVFQEGGRQS